jgi:valyl-tRNA synthetase
VPLAAGGAAAHRTRLVLGHALDTVLRLLHPVVPFVTEALWTALTGGESLVVASWPRADGSRLDPAAEAEVAALQDVVTEVRRFRSEQGLRPSQRVAARIGGLAATGIAAHEPLVRALTRLDTPENGFAPTASLSVRTTTVELDLSGAIDVAAERARLTKDLAAAEKELRTATAKLANTDFIDKAPDAVVAKVRTRLASAESDVERITGQLGALPTP